MCIRQIYYEPYFWSKAFCQPFYRCSLLCSMHPKPNDNGIVIGFWMQYLKRPLIKENWCKAKLEGGFPVHPIQLRFYLFLDLHDISKSAAEI